MKLVVTRIEEDGIVWRRTVDTAGRSDGGQWEASVARALATEPPPYRPVAGSPVCHLRLNDRVVMIAENDLTGPLRDLVTAVLAVGDLA